jgi:hypothetical protein
MYNVYTDRGLNRMRHLGKYESSSLGSSLVVCRREVVALHVLRSLRVSLAGLLVRAIVVLARRRVSAFPHAHMRRFKHGNKDSLQRI